MSRPKLLALSPLRIEANAVQRRARTAEVVTTGQGPHRARRAAVNLAARCRRADAVAILGFCGATTDSLQPGDVIVGESLVAHDELGAPSGSHALAGTRLLAAALTRAGLHTHTGPLSSIDHIARGDERAALAAFGALGVDMESAWLVPATRGRPAAVVRVVVDTPARELPSRTTLADGVRAYRSLRTVGAGMEQWAAAAGDRTVLLAAPRSFCAGVERAIDIVERALERFGAPVFVRRQIVHNRHVVDRLEARGAVFVEELDEVPDGATVVFSAHGVAPRVRAEADERALRVIDATCPLVAKVHAETRRFAGQGYHVVLVGHEGHEETEGTLGEHPAATLVTRPDDVDAIELDDRGAVAYVTQTTLAADEVNAIVARLRRRFPALVGPPADDICYATQNRQDAVRAIAPVCDALLVVGSPNSSNSNRLVEVARRHGCRAHLVDDVHDVELEWLVGAATVGITAGASAPDSLVREIVDELAALGDVTVEERPVAAEQVAFALPGQVR
jgi:4-hydroxy-3-methylbut-2-enyl diphosphate reductase